jgi:RING finger protein 113A
MEDTVAPVIFKKRGAKAKANIRKRPATPPPNSDSDYSSSEDETGQRIKRRKRNTGAVLASSRDNQAVEKDITTTTIFAADRRVPITKSDDATKQNNLYADDTDLSSKQLLGSTRSIARTGAASDGTYKGLANQTTFIEKNPDAPTRTVGPMKAATNIRTVTVMDFAPDVCKE